MNVLLARHGETAWNREGRYQGRTDIPLSAEGEAQARALGARLATLPIDRAVASPLARARRTAELALGERAALLSTDADLVEIGHGAWEGRVVDDIRASDGERLARWQAGPSADLGAGAGGECLAEVEARAFRALARACAGLPADATVLIVAHDAVNRVLLCRVAGIPTERVWSFQQAPATLNALRGPDVDHLQIVLLNDASHHLGPAGLFAGTTHRAL